MNNPLFPKLHRCALVGMVHLKPLPGSPRWKGSMAEVMDAAIQDAESLQKGGCDAIIVENMGDVPYVKSKVAHETFGAMTIITASIVKMGMPTGIQVLAAANAQAMAMAYITGAHFVRVEGFAYAHVADEGWIDACAGALLRQRNQLGADVSIWADIQKKHASHAITSDISIEDLAKGTAFCGADALIITGSSTGMATDIDDVQRAKIAGLPVVVGSGVCPEDAPLLAREASALIVGSWIKKEGNWRASVDQKRVKILRDLLDKHG